MADSFLSCGLLEEEELEEEGSNNNYYYPNYILLEGIAPRRTKKKCNFLFGYFYIL